MHVINSLAYANGYNSVVHHCHTNNKKKNNTLPIELESLSYVAHTQLMQHFDVERAKGVLDAIALYERTKVIPDKI
jgi:hypothetical protein